jgi:hypothetical protein
MREQIVEVVPDRRIGYTLLAGLDAPPGFGWIYVTALRRFTRRLLAGLTRQVRDGAATAQ